MKAADTATTADRTRQLSHRRERNSLFQRGLLPATIGLRVMRGVELGAGAGAIVAVVGMLGTAPPAHATDYGVALNGTYRATSNGDWAQSSQGPFGVGGAMVYRDQPTKVETWTVSSDCISPIQCIGEVTSDAGWTGPLNFNGDTWRLDRDI